MAIRPIVPIDLKSEKYGILLGYDLYFSDIEAEKKRMGINIAFHEDSQSTKVSPGVNYFSTPSEFNSVISKGLTEKYSCSKFDTKEYG